jgi:hypothetical protein
MLTKVVSSAGLGKMAPWTNIKHGALDPPQTDLETSESCELIDHSSNIFNNNNNNNLSGKKHQGTAENSHIAHYTHILREVLM